VTLRVDVEGRVAEVVMDYPPVNALPIQAWHDLAETLLSLGRDEHVNAVVLMAEGRGWCAGPDLKELASGGRAALAAVNRGCYAAFAAIYDCEVPVVAAIQGFCVGGGVGLAGNADVIIASEDAYFGLPELDRGALGAATHLARLVPAHRMRAMFYTGDVATAEELHRYGSVLQVVPVGELRPAARTVAERIAAKHPSVIRLAKESLNGIDAVDPKRSYRFEQGFTFELNLTEIPEAARRAFLEKREPRFEDPEPQ
jgi:enoyl-CoA hydratase